MPNDNDIEDDMDPNEYLGLDDGKALDFGTISRTERERTFEEDFIKELESLPEEIEEEEIGRLDKEDVDFLAESDREYQCWLNEGGTVPDPICRTEGCTNIVESSEEYCTNCLDKVV